MGNALRLRAGQVLPLRSLKNIKRYRRERRLRRSAYHGKQPNVLRCDEGVAPYEVRFMTQPIPCEVMFEHVGEGLCALPKTQGDRQTFAGAS